MTPETAGDLLALLRRAVQIVRDDLREDPVRWEVSEAWPAFDFVQPSLWGIPIRFREDAVGWELVSSRFVPDDLVRRRAGDVVNHGAKATTEYLSEHPPKHLPSLTMLGPKKPNALATLIDHAQGVTDAGPPADLSQIEADLQALAQPLPEPKKYLAPTLAETSKDLSKYIEHQLKQMLAVPDHLLAEDEAPPATHAEAIERAAIAQALSDLAETVLTNGLKANAIESLKATKDHVYRLNLTVTKETPPWKL